MFVDYKLYININITTKHAGAIYVANIIIAYTGIFKQPKKPLPVYVVRSSNMSSCVRYNCTMEL